MKKNYFTNRFIQYICLFGLLIAGVSCEEEDGMPTPGAEVVNMDNIKITGKQEVPETGSHANGTFSLSYNKSSNVLSYTINYTGITPTAMHFHKGEVGVAGDVAAAIEGPYTSGMTGMVTLTEAQEADLLAEKWYLNIHTDEFPAGEIRGQAVMENKVVFSNIHLSGSEQVPDNNSTATGVFNGIYDKTTKKLSYTLSLDGITPTAMHLHKGDIGANGDVVTEITGTSGTTAALTAEQEADLLAGKLYLNVHTDEFPAGEIRGQVMLGHQHHSEEQGEQMVNMNNIWLSSKQEVPANNSTASGNYSLAYNKKTRELSYTINYSGTTPTAMHFHKGEVGVAGDVAAAVEGPYTSGMTGSITLTEAQEADLLAGKWYLNIHSDAYAAGELRGQAVTDEKDIFTNKLSGANEVPASGSAASGMFYGVYDKSSKVLSYTITYSPDLMPTAMHIHKAAAGANGDVVVAVEGPYSSGMTGSVTLTADQEADLYKGLLYLNVHSALHEGGEVRAQLIK